MNVNFKYCLVLAQSHDPLLVYGIKLQVSHCHPQGNQWTTKISGSKQMTCSFLPHYAKINLFLHYSGIATKLI